MGGAVGRAGDRCADGVGLAPAARRLRGALGGGDRLAWSALRKEAVSAGRTVRRHGREALTRDINAAHCQKDLTNHRITSNLSTSNWYGGCSVSLSLKDRRWLAESGKTVRQILSPSEHTNGPFATRPQLLVMHFTYGASAESSANWFKNKENRFRSSAHIVIDRDGSIIQCVPLDVGANHAGRSSWRGQNSMNNKSYGMELANWGYLIKSGSGYKSHTGKSVPNFLLADHKNGNPHFEYRPFAWETYPEEQIRSAIKVAACLVKELGVNEIVGHDDISPLRKYDPGPAFDMDSFRQMVFGGRDVDGANTLTVRSQNGLRLRTGPGTEFDTIQVLALGTLLEPIEKKDKWILASVLDEAGQTNVTGWVHSSFVAFT